MKILITGGSGVIGWNLTEFLKSKDNDVSFTFNKNKIKSLENLDFSLTFVQMKIL